MILTLPVLLYQMIFIAIRWVASRIGRMPLVMATVACLAWTMTHLFFVPLAVLRTLVILVSAAAFYTRAHKQQASPG